MDYQTGSCKSQVRISLLVLNFLRVNFFCFCVLFLSCVGVYAQTTTNPLTTDITITAVVLAAPAPIPSPYFPPQPGPINMSESADMIVFRGVAYPGSVVSILKNGSIVADSPANSDGTFEVRLKNVNPGTYSFGVRAEDIEHLKSKMTLLTVFLSTGVVTIVDGIFIPPTITSDKVEVKKGDRITFMGRSAPHAEVRLSINSSTGLEVLKRASSSSSGAWSFDVDSAIFSAGDYDVKARSITEEDVSLYSDSISFRVGSVNRLRTKISELTGFRKKCDLNNDSRVNLLDFSIMAFWYKRLGFPAKVDLNTDNKINLTDLSILAYCWTG